MVVTGDKWYIRYYFPGPDLRYNGDFFLIDSSKIDMYILAWKNNFDKYLQLKKSLSLEGTYAIKGEAGMIIRIGGWRDGVCISGWHMNINEQSKINGIITDYQHCKVKAPAIQEILKSL